MKSANSRHSLWLGAVALGLFLLTTPASAQFTRVVDVPVTPVFSVFSKGDTIAVGLDTTVFISTDAGATWRHSTKPVAGVTSIQAVRIRNGLLYAGTFGQGVRLSDDLGVTWRAFNEGLVGGLVESQLHVIALEERGDSLYAGTSGAGVYVRRLTGPSTWSHFGEAFEDNQASNVNDLALGGIRLLATGGSNGQILFRDPGSPDWTVSNLDNVGIHAGRRRSCGTAIRARRASAVRGDGARALRPARGWQRLHRGLRRPGPARGRAHRGMVVVRPARRVAGR